jgi:segregation and condensation protein B
VSDAVEEFESEREEDAPVVPVALAAEPGGDPETGDSSQAERGPPSQEDQQAEAYPPGEEDLAQLARVVEALLFLSADPLTTRELADATQAEELTVAAALELLTEQYAPGRRGLQLRELAGGYTLATDPLAEAAARRLLSRPRAATLTPAQAETLAIVAYLQPVSRPEITRIRGVSADSAVSTLLERGLVEEAGRSQFGAVLYRTGTAFLKLFGLRSLSELPDVAKWDPTPEERAELRERLLRAGEARGEGGPPAVEG